MLICVTLGEVARELDGDNMCC